MNNFSLFNGTSETLALAGLAGDQTVLEIDI